MLTDVEFVCCSVASNVRCSSSIYPPWFLDTSFSRVVGPLSLSLCMPAIAGLRVCEQNFTVQNLLGRPPAAKVKETCCLTGSWFICCAYRMYVFMYPTALVSRHRSCPTQPTEHSDIEAPEIGALASTVSRFNPW